MKSKAQRKTQLLPKVNENDEINELNERLSSESQARGFQTSSGSLLRFDSFPISQNTLNGLKVSKLVVATDIQAATIPHALLGRDILAAAKTGSGKTLAFIIPLLEKLYRERWSQEDGLAALIITPTRELALQIFEVLRSVGKYHQMSAGLITGGKGEFENEQEKVIGMNILVATPGRLLQHFEQTSYFDASQLMVLILDEADRILDLGFKKQLDSILNYLPHTRQTMLFSATQTKSVQDLARLSLKNPQYLAIHAQEKEVTPNQLIQNYITCKLPEKLDILYSFIKTHLKNKIIVFFSTCSQVRFVFACFKGMQPGIPLTALHGKYKQERRTIIYMDFVKRNACCMFATDIAARGLDFPNIDWVIQVDAPEDSAMYIHRVGRTARYNAGGRALLMLMPQEEPTVSKMLESASINVSKLTVNPKKTFSVASQASALLASQPEYRLLAKKAFNGYLRSLQLLTGTQYISPDSLPVDEFAASLGLASTPEVSIVPRSSSDGRELNRNTKNINRSLNKLKEQIKFAKEEKKRLREESKKRKLDAVVETEESLKPIHEEEEEEDDLLGHRVTGKKREKLKVLKKKKLGATEKAPIDDNDDDDFWTVKQTHQWSDMKSDTFVEKHPIQDDNQHDVVKLLEKKLKKKQKINQDGEVRVSIEGMKGKKVLFDQDGNVADPSIKLKQLDGLDAVSTIDRVDDYARRVKERLDLVRKEDNLRERQRIKEKHLEARLKMKKPLSEKERGMSEDEDVDNGGVQLANYVPESDDNEDLSTEFDERDDLSDQKSFSSDDESEDNEDDEDDNYRIDKDISMSPVDEKREKKIIVRNNQMNPKKLRKEEFRDLRMKEEAILNMIDN